MTRLLWTLFAVVLAVNVVVVAGVSASAALEAIRRRREIRDLDELWRHDPRRSPRSADVGGGRGPAAILLGWTAVAALLVASAIAISPRARELVGVSSPAGSPSDAATPSRSVERDGGGVAGAAEPGGRPEAPPPVAAWIGAPAAPNILVIEPASSTQVVVGWTAVEGATGYTVERSVDELTWIDVAETGELAHTDGGLAPGTTYYYRVAARFPDEVSVASDPVVVTTVSAPPAAPTVVVTVAPEQVVLTWDVVAGAIGYRVERSPDGTTGWVAVGSTDEGVLTFSDPAPAPGGTAWYRVVAWNAGGDSPPSVPQPASTPATPPPPPASEAPPPSGEPASGPAEEAVGPEGGELP